MICPKLLSATCYFMLMILVQFSNIKAKLKLKSNWSEIFQACVTGLLTTNWVYTLDKTKLILFSTKQKLRNAKSLNIVYNGIEIKQHAKVKYLGCILDESLSGESMALNVINKINSRLKFLRRQNRFFTPPFT